jgi:hypothetical protein
MNETLTIKDIAKLMYVTPKTARSRKVTAPDFPRPAFQTSQRNRAWRRSDVMAYLGLTDELQSAQPILCSTTREADSSPDAR